MLLRKPLIGSLTYSAETTKCTRTHVHRHARTHTLAERSNYINMLISQENFLKTAKVGYLDDLARLKCIKMEIKIKP